MFQSYELKENMSPMKEDLLKCKKEVKKVDSVKRVGSKRSMGRRKRLREASGSFFKIASLRKEGGTRREKRPKRDQGEEKMTKQLERRRAGEAETGVIVLGMYFCENLLFIEYLPVLFSGSGSSWLKIYLC